MNSYAVLMRKSLREDEEIIRPCTWREALKVAAKEARELGFKRKTGRTWSGPDSKPPTERGYVVIVRE